MTMKGSHASYPFNHDTDPAHPPTAKMKGGAGAFHDSCLIAQYSVLVPFETQQPETCPSAPRVWLSGSASRGGTQTCCGSSDFFFFFFFRISFSFPISRAGCCPLLISTLSLVRRRGCVWACIKPTVYVSFFGVQQEQSGAVSLERLVT